MLGLDYQGQTALATLPQGTIVIKVTEPITFLDRVKANAIYRVLLHESVRIVDSIYQQVVLLLRVFEQLQVREHVKLSYEFFVREVTKVTEKMYTFSSVLVYELVLLSDSVKDIISLAIREFFNVIENLKVNGKDVFQLWQACYKKTIATVENVYKKFRR